MKKNRDEFTSSVDHVVELSPKSNRGRFRQDILFRGRHNLAATPHKTIGNQFPDSTRNTSTNCKGSLHIHATMDDEGCYNNNMKSADDLETVEEGKKGQNVETNKLDHDGYHLGMQFAKMLLVLEFFYLSICIGVWSLLFFNDKLPIPHAIHTLWGLHLSGIPGLTWMAFLVVLNPAKKSLMERALWTIFLPLYFTVCVYFLITWMLPNVWVGRKYYANETGPY